MPRMQLLVPAVGVTLLDHDRQRRFAVADARHGSRVHVSVTRGVGLRYLLWVDEDRVMPLPEPAAE